MSLKDLCSKYEAAYKEKVTKNDIIQLEGLVRVSNNEVTLSPLYLCAARIRTGVLGGTVPQDEYDVQCFAH